MINFIISIFVFIAIISLVEDRAHRNLWTILAVVTGCALITIATFKTIGSDADSLIYLHVFDNCSNPSFMNKIEPSFLWISQFCTLLGLDITGVFFIYALLAISIKIFVFRKFSEFVLLPLVIFISHFFILHDMIEIRASVATAFFLLGLYSQYQNKMQWTCVFYLIAACFHVSAIVAFVSLLFSNQPLTLRWKVALSAIVPLGYIFFFVNNIVPSFNINIPYIGEKIATYQELLQSNEFSEIYVFKNPTLLIHILIFYLLIIFNDKLHSHAPYISLLTKISGISLLCFFFFSFFPILSGRLYEFFGVVNILAFPTLVYLSSHDILTRGIIIVLSFISLFVDLFVYHYLTQPLI